MVASKNSKKQVYSGYYE